MGSYFCQRKHDTFPFSFLFCRAAPKPRTLILTRLAEAEAEASGLADKEMGNLALPAACQRLLFCLPSLHTPPPSASTSLFSPQITALASGSQHTRALSMCPVLVHSRENQLSLPKSHAETESSEERGMNTGDVGRVFFNSTRGQWSK